MLLTLLLAALGAGPYQHFVVDRVDLIELNEAFDEDGNLRHTQVIFWDDVIQPVDAITPRPRKVVAWRERGIEGVVPERDPAGGYRFRWRDTEYHPPVDRVVYAPAMKITRRPHGDPSKDPETVNQDFYPEDTRRLLTGEPRLLDLFGASILLRCLPFGN